MKKILILISVLIASTPYESFGQNKKGGIEYKKNIDKLISEKEIIYYGVDFSKCKISDAKWLGKTAIMKNIQIPEWIAILNKKYELSWITGNLRSGKISSDLNAIQMLCKDIKESELVSFATYSFPIDSVNSFVKSYKLTQTNGAGLVLIIENLNQPERYITGYWTFFDIETREVLYATKMKGLPGSKYGYSQYWKEGMVELYEYYFRDYYKMTMIKRAN